MFIYGQVKLIYEVIFQICSGYQNSEPHDQNDEVRNSLISQGLFVDHFSEHKDTVKGKSNNWHSYHNWHSYVRKSDLKTSYLEILQ